MITIIELTLILLLLYFIVIYYHLFITITIIIIRVIDNRVARLVVSLDLRFNVIVSPLARRGIRHRVVIAAIRCCFRSVWTLHRRVVVQQRKRFSSFSSPKF